MSYSSMASAPLLHTASLSPSSQSTHLIQSHKLLLFPLSRINNSFSSQHKPVLVKKAESFPSFRTLVHRSCPIRASSTDFVGEVEKKECLWLWKEGKAVKLLVFWVVLWASVFLGWHALCGDARAAVAAGAGAGADTIRGSGFGLKVANALRASGWPREAVVFALATLPVIELRGAIPVGYWLQLHPLFLTLLSVLGNMVPVPFIILYLKKVTSFLTGKNVAASRFLDMLCEKARHKAGPVKEFQWLGLMLFVAVPFPGTGAWTGAFIASVLDMPFWHALTANFVGVVLAGLLVNLLVNLGIKYAILSGMLLFVISTFMWSILRGLKKSLASSDDTKLL